MECTAIFSHATFSANEHGVDGSKNGEQYIFEILPLFHQNNVIINVVNNKLKHMQQILF